MAIRYIVGVDEAGRGPLAGPVSVGAICVPISFPKSFLKGVKDSKKLSKKKREEWFSKIKSASNKKLSYQFSFATAHTIDKRGIVRAVSLSISRALSRFHVSPIKTLVLLDGGLKAPSRYPHQKTIIGGDEKEPLIALASIVAKVLRDRRMVRYAKFHPRYSFEVHKGYGTALHRKLLKKYGPSIIHRRSFIKNLK
ncbi:MAG: ribonuclease HII [Patescibacteria group bacterium]